MRYLDWGGQGEPVILLHGLASSTNWYDMVAPHLRNDYRIIAPDQRGHGQTTQAAGGYDWGTLTEDVVGLRTTWPFPKRPCSAIPGELLSP